MDFITGANTQVRIGGTGVGFKDEPLITDNNVIYRISGEGRNVWNMEVPLKIEGIEADDKYDTDWANGFIKFKTAKIRDGITATGEYLTTTSIGKVTNYDFDKNRDFQTINFVGALGPSEIPLNTNITGSIDTLEVNDSFLLDAFNETKELLLEFQFGSEISKFWVYIESHGTSHSGDDLVINNISFRSL